MRKASLCLLALLAVTALRAVEPVDTIYVPHGATRTPHVEGVQPELRSRRMRGDTLRVEGVCFVRLPRLELVLCIGQSNMAGRGPMDSLAAESFLGVFLFNDQARFEPATEPMNRYSTIRKELSMQQIGPAGSFARQYAATMGVPVGVVVNARGGSAIGEWLPGSEQDFLNKALDRIRAAKVWGDVKAVLWHQGEADSAHPERYEAKFRRLVELLRAELDAPTLPVVFGEIAHWNWTRRAEGTAPFNAMLRNLRIPHTSCVSAEGLTPMRDDSDPHFSAASQRELGRRYAEALRVLLNDEIPN